MFNVFLNGLAVELKASGIGINFHGIQLTLLLYADDIVIFADNENDLQRLIDLIYDWCRKWRLSINQDKSQILHIRKR